MPDPEFSNEEVMRAVAILREDEILSHNQRMSERLDRIEERMGRMPVKELSAEEKAAEYDRLMAERQRQGSPPREEEEPEDRGAKIGGQPPAPQPKEEPREPAGTGNSRGRRGGYWGDAYGD